MKLIIVAILSLLITGCLSNIDKTRETVLRDYSEKNINESFVVGKTTKKEVIGLLGAPTSPEVYNFKDTWIYYSQKTERYIFLIVPINRDANKTLILTFDKNKVLTNVKFIDK